MKQKTTSGSPALGYRASLYCLLLLLSMAALRSSAQTNVPTNAMAVATTGATANRSAAQAAGNNREHKAYPENLVIQIDIALSNATYESTRTNKYKSYTMAGSALNTSGAADNFNERSSPPYIGGSPEIQDGLMTFTQAAK
jgi:hypothetical protein